MIAQKYTFFRNIPTFPTKFITHHNQSHRLMKKTTISKIKQFNLDDGCRNSVELNFFRQICETPFERPYTFCLLNNYGRLLYFFSQKSALSLKSEMASYYKL